jgi:FMNH2-dependent dimethyl sulfone monooxygenase
MGKEMEFGVWLPVYGGWLRLKDQRHRPHFDHCRLVAQRAEAHGFKYLYASENYLNCVYGPTHEVADVWVYLSAIAATTKRVELVGGVKPGFIPPFVMAHMITSLDWVSSGRATINIVCGWWQQEFEHCNATVLDHDRRYERAEEYVRCLKGLWTESPFSFKGDHYDLNDVFFAGRVIGRPHPNLWISGHSQNALEFAGKHGDVLFVNGMSPSRISSLASKARCEAARYGRELRIATNAFVLLEHTDDAAERRYETIVARRDRELIANFRSAMDASGAALWAGLSETEMVDSNAGFEARLVGSPRSIRRRLAEFEEAGVDIIMCQFEGAEEIAQFATLAITFEEGLRREGTEMRSV